MRILLILFFFQFSFQIMVAQDCDAITYQKHINRAIQINIEGKIISAKNSLDSLIQKLEKNGLNECKIYFQATNEKAYNLIAETKLGEAHKLYQEVIAKTLKLPFNDILADAYIGNALVYEWSHDMESCFSNLEKAKAVIDDHKLSNYRALYHVRLSSYHRISGDHQKALIHAKKALEYAEKYDDLRNETDALSLLTMLDTDTTKIQYYDERILNLYKQINNKLAVAIRYSNFNPASQDFNLEIMENRLDSAWHYISQVDERTTEFYLYSSLIAQDIEHFHRDRGNIKKAYEFALVQLDFNQKYKLLEARNQVEESELKIDLLEQKNKLKQIKRERFFLLIATGATLATLLGISWLLFYLVRTRNKIKIQNQEIIQTNKSLKSASDKNKLLLTEIHHRVKNNLQNIISLMILKSRKNKSEEVKNLIDDFSAKINSIALVHDQLYRGEKVEKITFADYVNELSINLHNISAQNIQHSIDISDCYLNIETTIPLGIILSELLNNTVKHNQEVENLSYSISLKKVNEDYTLLYLDNGKGLHPDHEKSEGMGLELIKILVRQLRGKLHLKAQKGMYCKIDFQEKEISSI